MVQAIGIDGQIQIVADALRVGGHPAARHDARPRRRITLGAPASSRRTTSSASSSPASTTRRPDRHRVRVLARRRPFEGCDVPEEVEVLTDGPHTLAVRAVDETGNADPTPATAQLDRRRPVARPTPRSSSAPRRRRPRRPRDLRVHRRGGADRRGRVRVRVLARQRRRSWPCTSPTPVHRPVGGTHLFQVRAVDRAGIQRPQPRLLRLDGHRTRPTRPRPTRSSPRTPGLNSGPDVIFGFNADEPVEEFECQLDNGPWEGCEVRPRGHRARVRPAHAPGARPRPRRAAERRPDARPATPGPSSASPRPRSHAGPTALSRQLQRARSRSPPTSRAPRSSAPSTARRSCRARRPSSRARSARAAMTSRSRAVNSSARSRASRSST